MKLHLYIILFCIILNLQAQDLKFQKAILKGKALIEEANSISKYQEAANYFERISKNEAEEWLPLYYQARAKIIIGNLLAGEEKEAHYQASLELIDQAEKLNNNAELIALRGFVHMMRLSADPATLGQSLSPLVFGLFQKAINLEPTNPRALLFMGQMEYGTSQFFGSSTEKACNYINRAIELFDQEAMQLTLKPTWGLESAKFSAEKCNQ
ncbi:MAG: hypothetical protein RIA69_17540 [Cyclobacteriaceae bacterium]